MSANESLAQRLGRALDTVTHQSDRALDPPPYGSVLLGRAPASPQRRRLHIRVMLTVLVVGVNLVGLCVAVLLVTVGIPTPRVWDAPKWITFVATPAAIVCLVALGAWWITRHTVDALRWAIEERKPTPLNKRNTLMAPWRVAVVDLLVWAAGAVVSAILYGMVNDSFIPRFLVVVSFCGILVATGSYLLAEFALRPVAALALEAGGPPRRLAAGIMGRTMMVWFLVSAVPVIGIGLLAFFQLRMRELSETQFAEGVLMVVAAAVVFGFILTCLQAWLTAAPVRAVRAALRRVEQGELPGNLVVFDGTELGELQRGFNAMVDGLRERERVRDLFGRHVGREVALAAERQQPTLGGEERHVAVVFIDIVGSSHLVTSQHPTEVVHMLNRFFAIVVDEVDRYEGLVNKFEGDAALAIFGAPDLLANPEEAALATGRAIAARLTGELRELDAGIGVAAGPVFAGNVGARHRFEYTVIGEPVNEAARLCELAKSHTGRLLATAEAVQAAGENERARWTLGESVMLRGHGVAVQLASPANAGKADR